MSDSLLVGEFSVPRGKKTIGQSHVVIDGQQINIPLFLINGNSPGPTLVIISGVHGAEYASVESALRFGRNLKPEMINGQVIVAPVVNLLAFFERSRDFPLDGINLNRVFPGKQNGSASEQLAYWIFQNLISKADYLVDLHGGDLGSALVPFVILHNAGDQQVRQKSLELAKAYGTKYIVCSELPGATFAAALEAGIPSILAEAGEYCDWSEKIISVHTKGLENLLRFLDMFVESPLDNPEKVSAILFNHEHWLKSEYDGFLYPKVGADQFVRAGQVLCTITDFEGNQLQSIEAPTDGVVLYITTTLAVKKGTAIMTVAANINS